jgi:hypothetical protein
MADDAMAEHLRRLREIINQHGWALQEVAPVHEQDLPFTYTAGLAAAGLPELIIVGLPSTVAAGYLNHFAKLALTTELTAGERHTIQLGRTAFTWQIGGVSAASSAEYLRVAHVVHGESVRALQLVWPDANGLLPGDAGYQPSAGQPLLA